MAEPLSEQQLAEIEARCAELAALSALLRRTGPAGSPHVSPAAVAAWLDDLCARDLPLLIAEIRRLRAEVAYHRALQQESGDNETERLRAALRRIASATWKTWFAEEAARALVQEARWALGDETPPAQPPR
jgi:hypothetical protein